MTHLPPFQALLDSYAGDVHRFLTSLVGPAEADDCFQETFLAALRAYPALRNDHKLKSWLLTIAHRKAIDRARAARPSAPLTDAPDPIHPAPTEPDPALWAEVAALPEKQRAAVVLRFVNDMTYRDVGIVLDCSEAAARRSTHDGLKRLREVIER